MRQNDTNEERTKVIERFSPRAETADRQVKREINPNGFHPATAKSKKNADNARQNSYERPRPVTEEFQKPKIPRKESATANEPRKTKSENGNVHTPSPFTGLLLAIITVIAIVSFITVIRQTTKIDKITITSEDVGFNDRIMKICEKLSGKSYIGLDSKDIEKAILTVSPLISDYKLTGKFPRELNVFITYEKSVYYTCTEEMFYTLSPQLKVLNKGRREDTDLSSIEGSLIKLYLPSFNDEEIGEKLGFSSGEDYIFRICETLSDYTSLGKLSSIDLRNTQKISFIFEERFRCDLGDYNDVDVKLTAAENIFKNRLGGLVDSDRTAVINVSNPSSASIRTDVLLEDGE